MYQYDVCRAFCTRFTDHERPSGICLIIFGFLLFVGLFLSASYGLGFVVTIGLEPTVNITTGKYPCDNENKNKNNEQKECIYHGCSDYDKGPCFFVGMLAFAVVLIGISLIVLICMGIRKFICSIRSDYDKAIDDIDNKRAITETDKLLNKL